MSLLRLSQVSKSFGEHLVLRHLSLELAEGERVALMGPSGSGKSTLLNCISGIEEVDEGDIIFDGVSLRDLDEVELCQLRRERIATVFQFFHLLPTLTAWENVEFALQLGGVKRGERRERTEQLLEEVGLRQRADAWPSELSGGERQRAAIARAMAVRPRLILADEPTGNLDSSTGSTILALLEKLGDTYGTAMVLVTHAEEVTRICHRVLTMRDGALANSSLHHHDR